MVTATGGALVPQGLDADEALSVIDRFGVTHSQWVQTMSVRMLKLGEEKLRTVDVSRSRSAAPRGARST